MNSDYENKSDLQINCESTTITNLNTREDTFENLEIESIKCDKKHMLKDDLLSDATIKFIFYKKLRKIYTFIYIKGEPLIVIGPHWPFFIVLFSIMSLIASLYYFLFWNKLLEILKVIGVLTYSTFIVSYILTAFTNPGLPKKNLWINSNIVENDLKNYRICPYCQVLMNIDENTTHCDECDICVEGYDHHCPWTSKCIGKGNLKMFYVFVISCLTLIIFYIVVAFSLTI